jgi:hypothetical protein
LAHRPNILAARLNNLAVRPTKSAARPKEKALAWFTRPPGQRIPLLGQMHPPAGRMNLPRSQTCLTTGVENYRAFGFVLGSRER